MIALIRQVILCVTAASLFGAVALALVKDGALKEIVRMGVGLVLILSLIIPLRNIFSLKLPNLFVQKQNIQQEDTEEIYQQAVLEQVEAEASQYVVKLAEEYGIDCTADVTADISEEGMVSISVVRIAAEGSVPEQQQYTLRRQIVQELDAEEIDITTE